MNNLQEEVVSNTKVDDSVTNISAGVKVKYGDPFTLTETSTQLRVTRTLKGKTANIARCDVDNQINMTLLKVEDSNGNASGEEIYPGDIVTIQSGENDMANRILGINMSGYKVCVYDKRKDFENNDKYNWKVENNDVNSHKTFEIGDQVKFKNVATGGYLSSEKKDKNGDIKLTLKDCITLWTFNKGN